MKRLMLACVLLVACNKKSQPVPSPEPTPEPPPVAVVDKALPPANEMPGLEFKGEPVKQAADFPKNRWVRTVLFDGKTPYIGFTYVDPSKGNCIKGEEIAGLSPEELKTRLHADFPSSSMEPIPEGHPMTLLTPEEIKQYDLPAEPAWVAYYK